MNAHTTEELDSLFTAAEAAADEADREATKGPFNPFGHTFDHLVWCGSVREAWADSRRREAIVWAINSAREDRAEVGEEYDTVEAALDHHLDEQFEELREEIDAALLRQDTVVGTGRPIYLASQEGYDTVFCEFAEEEDLLAAVESFYSSNDLSTGTVKLPTPEGCGISG